MTRTTPTSSLVLLLLCAMLSAATFGCAQEATQPQATAEDNGSGGKEDIAANASSLCVGVRGNGARIFSHFGAMARIHEHYGLIDGVAGGSSGSITSFLTESMYSNPSAFFCGDERCSEDQAALRISLMFKTMEGYLGELGNTDEAQAFLQVGPLVAKVKEGGVEAMIQSGDLESARAALIDILESDDIRALVNPELVDLLRNSPDPAYHVMDIWGALSNFGSFSVDNSLIFVRPGLLSFRAVSDKVGRIGSFYAGYGPTDSARWDAFLDGCAPQSQEKTWAQIAPLDAGDGVTCHEHFVGMLTSWREELLKDELAYPSRIDDPIGRTLPSLISTSVLQGDAAQTFAQARADYQQGKEYAWDINFDDVRFGYWGQKGDLQRTEDNTMGYTDAKTAKFLSLGEATWREALSLSPAEPGLTRALEINDTLVSAGGWSDLAPTLVLKNMGCEEVILVTREGEVQGGFGPKVAGLLGMDSATDDALYKLDGDSAVRTSLEEADGVWCTNWDGFTDAQFSEVFRDGYEAPLQSSAASLTDNASPYKNVTGDVNLPACTPGVR